MLPSRLFKNTGLPPPLRSLITPHASLPSTLTIQLRFRLGVMPMFVSTPNTRNALGMRAASSSSGTRSNDISAVTPPPITFENHSNNSSESTTTSQVLAEKMVPKLQITFTCTVPNCGERSTHQFTKQAYEHGVVLVQCPKCKNRHLIADHLNWFTDGTKNGKLPRIEDILREKGETVRKGIITDGGDISYTE